jgi:hypothetical protein
MALLKSDEDDDDFFGPQQDAGYGSGPLLCEDGPDSGLAAAEFAATADRFRILGYHETYDASKDVNLQAGFEEGYRQNYEVSLKIGESLGKASMSAKLSGKNNKSANCTPSIEPSYMQAARLTRRHLTKSTAAENDNSSINMKKLETEVTALLSKPRAAK